MVSVRPKFDGYLDEYYCLSTDTKPTADHVANGSTLVEIDTGKKYMYDKENRSWHAKSSGGGSGGGSGSGSGSGSTGGGFEVINCAIDETSQMPYIPMPAGELFQLCMENAVLLGMGDDSYAQITYFVTEEGAYTFTSLTLNSPLVFVASDSASYPQFMLPDDIGSGSAAVLIPLDGVQP